MLHPDAFGDGPAQTPTFQGALGAAEQFGHSFLSDLVDVTGAFGFHGMVSTPPVAAVWSVGAEDFFAYGAHLASGPSRLAAKPLFSQACQVVTDRLPAIAAAHGNHAHLIAKRLAAAELRA
ncbi:hypothetical protein [Pseudomonas soli]|uniref:hypothetical protein n=1 Tax=Pseudomonas soli TaxID=1306993 RepID=UPI003D000E6C